MAGAVGDLLQLNVICWSMTVSASAYISGSDSLAGPTVRHWREPRADGVVIGTDQRVQASQRGYRNVVVQNADGGHSKVRVQSSSSIRHWG